MKCNSEITYSTHTQLWFVQLSTQGQGLHSVLLSLCLGTSLAFTLTQSECPCHAQGGSLGRVQMTGGSARHHKIFIFRQQLTFSLAVYTSSKTEVWKLCDTSVSILSVVHSIAFPLGKELLVSCRTHVSEFLSLLRSTSQAFFFCSLCSVHIQCN